MTFVCSLTMICGFSSNINRLYFFDNGELEEKGLIMKISYNWLKDYLDVSIDPHQLADRLSLIGLEVEEVIERHADFPQVVIGRVLAVDQHPNADRLKVCKVNIGEEELTIICGAPNVATGQTVPVAKVGASLPSGLKIQKSKIRGVNSNGMICSEAELSLADKSDGIWILPDNLPLGAPLDKALNMQTDYIFDISVTPNRPDCLSHIGIAREVGAILGKPLSKPSTEIVEIAEKALDKLEIIIETPVGCPRYSARLIRNVKIGASPSWLVQRLEAVGMRSINNVVDITNYVLMETGHPLHAFDFDLIQGGKIIVRESREGEKFVTLDDKERILKEGTVLICDTEQPVALGGIMGGLNSEVSSSTVNVLLESAYFKPESIQISSRHLNLSTEASQRFERGTDPNGNIYALERATQLIAKLCDGEVYQGIVDAYPSKIEPKHVTLNEVQINNLLGTDLSSQEMTDILQSIGFIVQDKKIVVPTFRPDITRVADLAEEVARLYGLENIPARDIIKIDYNVPINKLDLFVDQLKEVLTGMGIQEVITNSMINTESWQKMTGKRIYPIFNPISKDMDGLRNSLLPSLVQVIQYNRNRKISDLRIFEINHVFIAKNDLHVQPEEDLQLAIVIIGKREGNLWFSSRQVNDFFDIKGLFEALAFKISLDNWQFISYSDFVLEGAGLGLKIGEEVGGFIGRINKKILDNFEIDEDVFVAQLSVTELFKNLKTKKKYQPIPRYPSVERDLAFIIDDDLKAQEIIDLSYRTGGNLLSNIEIFDIFRGTQIPEGKKSLAFHYTFQATDRTLTEEEVNRLMEKIIASVKNSYQAKLRE